MAERAESTDINLDRLEPRFRRLSAYSAAIAGYAVFALVVAAAVFVLALPIGGVVLALLASNNADSADIGVTALNFGLFFLGAAIIAPMMYGILAELLRLGRVFALFLAASVIALFLVAILDLGIVAVAIDRFIRAFSAENTNGRAAELVLSGTLLMVGAVSSISALIYGRLGWSYVAAAFARPEHRRMLMQISRTDARNSNGRAQILGGGISMPTLRKGSLSIRALNMARCVFAGLSLFVLLAGLLNLVALLNVNDGINAHIGDPSWTYTLSALVLLAILAAFGLAGLLNLCARLCLQSARKRARFALDEVRLEDPRAPTLFLRPFRDDQVELTRNSGKGQFFGLEPRKRQLDHILVEEFSWSGPVVAIGRPGETQLPFGAARTFLPNDVWQQEALALATAAGHIVMVVDDTPGVLWEIEQVTGDHLRQKTLFLFHPRFVAAEANRKIAASIADRLGCDVSTNAAPVLALWLDHRGEARVMRSSTFSVEAFTLALRAFFRTRAEDGVREAKRQARSLHPDRQRTAASL